MRRLYFPPCRTDTYSLREGLIPIPNGFFKKPTLLKKAAAIAVCGLLLLPSACGKPPAEDAITNMLMTSGGVVILTAGAEVHAEVYDRYGDIVYDKLEPILLADYPEMSPYLDGGGSLYMLDFAKLFAASEQTAYKCVYIVDGHSGSIENNYIISRGVLAAPEILSSEVSAKDGSITLTVRIEPKFARLFHVWTGSVPEAERFPASALKCVSTYDQLAQGVMVYSCPAAQGDEIVFYTRALYNLYGYSETELEQADNTDYPDFVSPFVCIDVGNPSDTRVSNLGRDGSISKYTVCFPSESVEIARARGDGTVPNEPEEVKLTAELTASGGNALLRIEPYPSAVFYRTVITELCGGTEKVIYNGSVTPGKAAASAPLRTDLTASYRATVYAKLSDGKTTEKLEVEGFTTSFVPIPDYDIAFKDGEVTVHFPKGSRVTVWRSGSPVSTDTLVIGVNNSYSYVPPSPGAYGFVFKVIGNGAEILDSGLLATESITVG